MKTKKTVNRELDVRGDGHSSATAVRRRGSITSPGIPVRSFRQTEFSTSELRGMVERTLTILGEDPSRNGLLKTPERVEKALRFMTRGYSQDIDELLNGALFPIEYDEMVIVKDIDFFSLCEHHLLPFFGRCHVGYMPNKRVVGLSKIPRLVDAFSRRLQVQERLTVQIAETLQAKLKAHGVAVVMEARHLCMMMRGVEKQNTVAVTSSMLGVFRTQLQTREEFLKLIHRGDGD